jgi:class I fructose-bisphosphate aldolase
MYEEIREMGEEAKSFGLPVIIWAYARGEGLNKDDETAIDTISYSAHLACQLGATVVKVKPPTKHIAQEASRKVLESQKVKIDTLADRIRLVVQSCFNGKRVVIFSGGEAKSDEEVLNDVRGLAAGGAFGSIMGRNAFQRPKSAGVKLLKEVMAIFRG